MGAGRPVSLSASCATVRGTPVGRPGAPPQGIPPGGSHDPEPTGPASLEAPMTTQHAKVLVVDDEPDVLLLCRVNLEFEGYEVVEAADGHQALERIREDTPDVVLLDVMMPDMDGWEVLGAIKGDPALKDIPVVMLTAKVQDQDQLRGWSQGAADYITKPFSPLALSQVLQDVLATDPEEEERRRRIVLEKLRLLREG
jgi:CheY-like chemotaxis protein